jgi:hypothetical protein
MTADLFRDILPSILQTKKDILEDEKDYVPFIVNRALSFHYDCVYYANMMNMNYHLDKKLQYHFLLNSIRPYKRPFQKWQKRETIEALEAVKEWYKYSNEKAKEALSVLSDDQIDELIRNVNKGGSDAKSRRPNMGKPPATR